MTIIEAEGFPKLIPTSAVVMDQPFGLFFSAGIVLIPVIFECMRTPPVPAGRGGRVIRIVKFGIVRHLFSLLAHLCQVKWCSAILVGIIVDTCNLFKSA